MYKGPKAKKHVSGNGSSRVYPVSTDWGMILLPKDELRWQSFTKKDDKKYRWAF